MYRLFISLISLTLLAGCEATPTNGDALLRDAIARIEAGECGVSQAHAMIAARAGYPNLFNKIHHLRAPAHCPHTTILDPGQEYSLEPPISVSVSAVGSVSSGNRINWSLVWLQGLVDPAAARAHRGFQNLPDQCRRYATAVLPKSPELIDLYLEQGGLRPLAAMREHADKLSPCAEASTEITLEHLEAGEEGWAAFWFESARSLGYGAEEPISRHLLEQAEHPGIAERYRDALAFALLERVMLEDYDALERLAKDGTIARSLTRNELGGPVTGAVQLATAAGIEPHQNWLNLEQSEPGYSDLLTQLAQGGGLQTDETPPLFSAVREACAVPVNSDILSGLDNSDQARHHECRKAHQRIGIAAGLERAEANYIRSLFIDAAASGGINTELLSLVTGRRKDELIDILQASEAPAVGYDVYGCPRPSDTLRPYWQVARPAPETNICQRLAEIQPDPADFEAMTSALPFVTCDVASIANAEPNSLLPAYYAAQAGRAEAFDCLAEAAALSASQTQHSPAKEALVVAVHAGVRAGYLDEVDWSLAGGELVWSIAQVIDKSETDFGHLEAWASGPEPFEWLEQENGASN